MTNAWTNKTVHAPPTMEIKEATVSILTKSLFYFPALLPIVNFPLASICTPTENIFQNLRDCSPTTNREKKYVYRLHIWTFHRVN